MNFNNKRTFNPKMYEDQLSTFGKKVLKVLVSQWQYKNNSNNSSNDADRHLTNRFRRYNECYRANSSSDGLRRLNFLESEAVVTLNLPPPVYNRSYNVTVNNITSVPKSTELSDTPIDARVGLSNSCCVQSTGHTSTDFKHTNDLIFKSTPETNSTLLNKELTTKEINYANNADDVPWNDIFDSELFSDEKSSEINKNDRVFQIKFPNTQYNTGNLLNENSKITTKMAKDKPSKKENINKKNPANNSKVKRANTTIIDIIPKKVKKLKNASNNETKNFFRKQSYSTAVCNWLDEVVPQNTTEEEPSEIDVEIGDVIESSINETVSENIKIKKQSCTKKRKIEIYISKIKDSTKKVVQSKLTNKGGVMKYDKPKSVFSTNYASNTSKQLIYEENKNTKEKKGKSKFVAPIKSQIPVKDIIYKIDLLEEDNVKNHKIGQNQLVGTEVFAVLVFSNGFNQLNKHYTEDGCVPEGIMLHYEECFYYLNGKSTYFRDHVKNLLNKQCVIGYGGKKLLMFLKICGLDIHDLTIQDMKVGGGLIDPDNPPDNFSDLQKLLGFSPEFTIETDCPLQKAAWYLTLLNENAQRLKTLLIEKSLWKVFVEIEMKILPIIANMELKGLLVDVNKLKSMESILINKMKLIEQECYKAAGKKFQINSTVQVRSLLYDELQLDTKSNIKIKETLMQGAKSTSETMLRNLTSVHPLPKLILEYRRLHKAHATFLTGIAQHVTNGTVRPTWEQMAAATGRIAANNPNIQAIPKALFSLNEAECEESSLNFRAVYLARWNCALVAADFQHVECRVFAHAAADATLSMALKSGQDLFKVLAAKWLKKPELDVSSEDRERTKRIVYASLYGAGARKLMDILNVGYEEALSVLTSFNRTFPSLKSFGRSVVSRCEQNDNKLSTICGRVRHFNNICSNDMGLKSHAERQAVNFVVQGSAADLCKMAMVLTEKNLRDAAPPIEAQLLLQIHDELVWEVKEEHLHRAAAIIKDSMQSCGQHCGLSVALPVTIKAGRSWGELETLKI